MNEPQSCRTRRGWTETTAFRIDQPERLLATTLLSLPLVAGFFGEAASGIRFLRAFPCASRGPADPRGASAAACPPVPAGTGCWPIAFGCAAILTVTGTSFLPGLGPVQAAFQPKDELSPVYRLLQINLRFDNPEPGKVLSLIGRVRPDMMTLNEVSAMWAEKLALLSSAYPVPDRLHDRTTAPAAWRSCRCGRSPRARRANASTAEPSRSPQSISAAGSSRSARFICIGPGRSTRPGRSTTCAAARRDGRNGHPRRRPQRHAVERRLGSHRRRRRHDAGRSCRPDLALSQRCRRCLRFAGLPIDQIFAKGDVVVHSVSTLEAVGSDHLPVLVEFSLKAAEPGRGGPADGDRRARCHRIALQQPQRPASASINPSTRPPSRCSRASNLIWRASYSA